MTRSVVDSGVRAPRRKARARRRAFAGLLAVIASLSAHALVAALAGVSLFALGPRAPSPASNIEVDLASPAPSAELAPPEPPMPPDAEPAHAPSRPAVAANPSRARAAGGPARPTTAARPAAVAAWDTPPTAVAPLALDPVPPPVLFAMSAGTIAGRAPSTAPPSPNGTPVTAGLGGSGSGVAGDGPLDAAVVDVPARLVTSRPAVYPPSARRAEVEADVPLEIVVAADGGVSDARVLGPHGYGLDGAAMEAVRAYRFSPARRAGRAVPVRMRWTVQFRLR